MKKYVYLVIDENDQVRAVYDNATTAEKLVPALEKKLEVALVVVKKQLNPEVSVVK